MTQEHDKTKGIYNKFYVERTDGQSAMGCKHDGCDYFVLDLTHDKHAPAAIQAYANSCRSEYPALASDLNAKFPRSTQQHDAETVERVAKDLLHIMQDAEGTPISAYELASTLAEQAIAAMPAREVTGWQPIETAPKDGVCKDIWVDGFGRIPNVHNHSSYRDATHWMPRPTAPEVA